MDYMEELIKELEYKFVCKYEDVCLGNKESCLKCTDYCIDYEDFKQCLKKFKISII